MIGHRRFFASAATDAGLAPAFNQVSLFSRSPASFDELSVISYTAVPEPTSTATAAGSGALLLAWFHRRRKAGAHTSRN